MVCFNLVIHWFFSSFVKNILRVFWTNTTSIAYLLLLCSAGWRWPSDTRTHCQNYLSSRPRAFPRYHTLNLLLLFFWFIFCEGHWHNELRDRSGYTWILQSELPVVFGLLLRCTCSFTKIVSPIGLHYLRLCVPYGHQFAPFNRYWKKSGNGHNINT